MLFFSYILFMNTFIITCANRTGSNLLMDYLMSHSIVKTKGQYGTEESDDSIIGYRYEYYIENTVGDYRKTIHLVRNPFHSLVSNMLAIKTKRYTNESYGDLCIELNPYGVRKHFERYYKEFERVKVLFPRSITVEYKDLNKINTHERIQMFLNLPIEELSTNLNKQNKRKYCDIVTNYSEIKAFFNNTMYSNLIIEESL